MLEVYELTKEYKKLRAVDQLTFTIRPGEIVGLLGPNGAGKTTRCDASRGSFVPLWDMCESMATIW